MNVLCSLFFPLFRAEEKRVIIVVSLQSFDAVWCHRSKEFSRSQPVRVARGSKNQQKISRKLLALTPYSRSSFSFVCGAYRLRRCGGCTLCFWFYVERIRSQNPWWFQRKFIPHFKNQSLFYQEEYGFEGKAVSTHHYSSRNQPKPSSCLLVIKNCGRILLRATTSNMKWHPTDPREEEEYWHESMWSLQAVF